MSWGKREKWGGRIGWLEKVRKDQEKSKVDKRMRGGGT